MAVKLQSGEYQYSKTVRKTHREKRAILVALPVILAGINMLGGLPIEVVSSWLDYKISKSMTHAMVMLNKNDKLFYNGLKVLETQQQF